jgi:hypothetical protein
MVRLMKNDKLEMMHVHHVEDRYSKMKMKSVKKDFSFEYLPQVVKSKMIEEELFVLLLLLTKSLDQITLKMMMMTMKNDDINVVF